MGTSDRHFGRQAERFNGLFRAAVPLAKRAGERRARASVRELTRGAAPRGVRSAPLIITIVTDTSTHFRWRNASRGNRDQCADWE